MTSREEPVDDPKGEDAGGGGGREESIVLHLLLRKMYGTLSTLGAAGRWQRDEPHVQSRSRVNLRLIAWRRVDERRVSRGGGY